MKRARAATALFVLSFTLVRPALADDEETGQCIASHVDAQRLRRDGKLRGARDALVLCARPSCPKVLVEECAQLLASVNQAIPTLVFEARDAQGHDIADARVFVGPTAIVERLDGKAVQLDAGEYTFRFERAGAVAVEVPIVVREGDSARRIAATLVPLVKKEPELVRKVSPGFWVAGALGLASLGAFGALAGVGYAKKGDLDAAACKPDCPTSEVDEVRRLFVAADVLLGLGIAALAVTPIIYFTSPLEPVSGSTPAPTALSLSVSPDGGSFMLGGRF